MSTGSLGCSRCRRAAALIPPLFAATPWKQHLPNSGTIMSGSRFSSIHIEAALALGLAVTIGLPQVQGVRIDSANSTHQQTSTIPHRKVNGKIAFTSGRAGSNTLTIWTMNADGSNPTQLTNKPASSRYVYDSQPTWSPDGSKIAFRSIGRHGYGNSIYLMNADGSNLQEVVVDFSGVREPPEIGSFDWSPDGGRFVFDAGGHGGVPEAKLTTNLFTARVDGKDLVRLTNDTEVMNGSPQWSPDGRTIVFVSDARGLARAKIQLINADGTNRQTVRNGCFPSWSPDGSKILFAGLSACSGGVCQQLYTVHPDGSALTQVTNNAGSYGIYSAPRYSPDGAKIVFERGFPSPYYLITEIFVMDADGNNQFDISNRPHTSALSEVSPAWQPLSAPPHAPPPSVLGFSEKTFLAMSSAAQIVVRRTGNPNQTVSCDYQVRHGDITAGLPAGSLSFAPGETSRTIPFSYEIGSATFDISLFNNAGNATFIGGTKDATIIFAPPNDKR
jgi:Tol biopolymer transport system component